jgi:hypothetical protein
MMLHSPSVRILPDTHSLRSPPMKTRTIVLLALSIACTSSLAQADVKLPGVISSHMVLQRDKPAPIWGTAVAGEQVIVKFRNQEKSATADAQGKWSVRLDPLTAGGPDSMTISGKNTLTLDDVLVGEVWVGSGQSNMAGAVANYSKTDPGLAKLAESAPYPKLRLVRGSGSWNEAGPQQVQGASALLFSFGVRLQKELDVPVGLMLSKRTTTARRASARPTSTANRAPTSRCWPSTRRRSPLGKSQPKKPRPTGPKLPARHASRCRVASAAPALEICTTCTSGRSCRLPSVACCGTKAKAAPQLAASTNTT